ncbi:hypothetical protein CB0940_05523 [Cercospora beticola]|uniref:Uncharacterized protein n=1 Tax=Cercospora beticola TaxID=122368 RepID=A0A2G5HZZ6_CERBT|nr:hypothetical protein CB0940_05523 [Cercospora beticola]PIA98081.1 hypothetical protein CB0940_05523 [Cercospora beticola]WPA98079.1 hypothetical protein RHO25_002690 [Cercospora beticola]CAK1359291.1 unnamed protein product [Cercospora beticola]
MNILDSPHQRLLGTHWLQDNPSNVLETCGRSPMFKPKGCKSAFHFENLTLIFYLYIGNSLQLFNLLHDDYRTIVCPYIRVPRQEQTAKCIEVVVDALSSVFAECAAFGNLQIMDFAYIDPLQIKHPTTDTEVVDLEVAVLLSLGNDASLYQQQLLCINNGDQDVYYVPTTSLTSDEVSSRSGAIFSDLGFGCSWDIFQTVFERQDRCQKWCVQRAWKTRLVDISRLTFDALQFIFSVRSRTISKDRASLCALVTYKPAAPTEGIFFFQFTVAEWLTPERRSAAMLRHNGEVYVVLGPFSKLYRNLLRGHEVAAKTGFTPQWDFMLDRESAGRLRVSWIEANEDIEMSPGAQLEASSTTTS